MSGRGNPATPYYQRLTYCPKNLDTLLRTRCFDSVLRSPCLPTQQISQLIFFFFRVREAADEVGPFIFREREQMQWAPSCSRPGLASILGRSLPALLAVPNSFPEQSWDNLVFSKSRKHLWRIKKKKWRKK